MVKMSTVWDRTAEFLSDNIGAIVPIALIAFFVPASIGGSFQAVFPTAGPGLAFALALVQLAFAILSLWGSLVITAMAIQGTTGETAGAIAFRRLPKAFAVWIALGVAATAAIIVPVSAYLAAAGYDMTSMARGQSVEMSRTAATVVILYLLLAIIAYVWLSARLIVITPVIVREGRMFGAIHESWNLTRGSTWRIVGVLILFAVVAVVSWLAANTVFGSIFALVAGGGEGGVSLAGVLTSIVTAAVQTAFQVLLPAFTAKLYLALSGRAGRRTHVPTP